MRRDPRLSKRGVTRLADDASLRWVCGVVRSGFHNGAHCRPDESHHHSDWGCGYYWTATIPAQRNGRLDPTDRSPE